MNVVHTLILSAICFPLLSGCAKPANKDKTAAKAEVSDTTNQPENSQFSGSQFSEHIRSSKARTPEEERLGFKLPPGFEIELFASEPEIGKPINIAFDAQGRLWVTQSYEYPFAASPGKGNDRLTILEDTDNDGKADRFIKFNDTLNIPIGILPIHDGAVAYSIPHVYQFTDAEGDGKAESQKVLLGPFGHKDTHGMINNLVRGYDGWVHAGHGFSNTSVVAGADGDSIRMESGNTFRFRPDGSRVEQTTFGRVNPFGLAYDEYGYLYSTDCHTSPIYQLIRGADYPHFGKKPEGIGFGPDMKPHDKESTALAGIAYYASSQFPEAYRKNFFIGDVITCRIYRNSFEFKGTTPIGKQEPDFLLSADPWFRPVDVEMGPDGALYVADFYNSIIGHYEVPLDHPERDRIRGRIWRISYKGDGKQVNKEQKKDWTKATVNELVAALAYDNLPTRMTAADQLTDRIGNEAVNPVIDILNKKNTPSIQYVHGLWVLHRLNALSEDLLTKASSHPDPVIRVHAMRILTEKANTAAFYPIFLQALHDADPHVQRAAIEAIAKHPTLETVEALLAHKHNIPDYDSHHLYTVRLWLRNILRNENVLHQVVAKKWQNADATVLADVMTGVNAPDAGVFLFAFSTHNKVPEKQLPQIWQHMARFVPAAYVDEVVHLANKKAAGNTDAEFVEFTAIRQGMAQRGIKETDELKKWGAKLAQMLLEQHFPENAVAKAGNNTVQMSASVTDQQKFAVEIAGDYKLIPLEPNVKASLQAANTDHAVKVAAAKALLQLSPENNIGLIENILQDDTQPVEFRRQLISILGEFPGAATRKALANITNVPPALQREIVLALASSLEGKSIIFRKVKNGEIFPRILMEPKSEERILLKISDAQRAEYKELITSLPPVNEEKNKLIADRLVKFTRADSLVSTGHTVFIQNCAPCHKIGNEGGMIGPQLTGIGNWGANALTEKIMDPNRNISEAFRNYTITLKDGKVITGLYRRDEGEVFVFADAAGQEMQVPKKNIVERKASKYTLMPDNFGDRLSQQEYNALLSYLLSIK